MSDLQSRQALCRDGHDRPGLRRARGDRAREGVGQWPVTQYRDWERLSVEQRERLADLGVPEAVETVRPRRSASSAFDQGVGALAQYAVREGRVIVPRAHTEVLPGKTVRLRV
ncbi:hypothetical protein [Streptomyces sp. NPDC048272]|uniref:hypothetical protein n=1 Tax=Streptomyces sp. NPDC048272 TaxID=3154616 RepID=UPI00342080AE